MLLSFALPLCSRCGYNGFMSKWKPVTGFDATYEVSDDGRVRRVLKTGVRKEISQKTTKGYQQVCLWKSGKPHWRLVHRLVVDAFVEPIPDGLEVNHKNGKRDDNRAANLEVVTRSDNCLHRHRVLGCQTNLKPMKGVANGSSKLTEEIVLRMRADREESGTPYAALGARYGVTPRMAWLIVKRKAWSHI